MHNSKTKWLISIAMIALMFAVVSGVSAQSNITATLSVNRTGITVGDVIPLTLQVTHPAGWRVIVPTLEKQWGDFELRSQSTPVIAANGDGTETTSQTIEIARMRPGETQTPALKLAVADDHGNLQNVDVAPAKLTVQSVLVPDDTTLRDLKPQANLITSQRTLVPIIIFTVLCVMLSAIYGLKRWRNRPVVDKRTPREHALDALKVLEARNPRTPEDIKLACIEIAICLRNYVASVTPIPARDLTTNELARQLKLTATPAEWSTRVIEVLLVCDAVKFAHDVLELTTIHGLIETVELLVKQYPAEPAQPATPSAKRTKWNGVRA
jgi:hypothetical protein